MIVKIILTFLIIWNLYRRNNISNLEKAQQINKKINYSMFRAIPVSNKLCFDKQLKRNWKIHEQKLSVMRSQLSKQKTEQFTFLEQSRKRNVLKDIQNREISRSNNILFKKIQSIETKGNKNSYLRIQKEKSVPNLNYTLHEPYRRKELYRIIGENHEMLKRIKDKKSAYNFKLMQKQRKQIEKNISLISEFKYKNYPVTQTKVNFYMKQNMKQNQLPTGSRVSNKNEDSCPDILQSQPRCKTSFKNKGGPQRHKYFSQMSKIINDSHYIITTYMNKNIFYIQVQNLSNSLDKYRMQMNQEQLQKLLSTFYNSQLDKLVDNLEIDSETQSCFLKLTRNPLIKQPNDQNEEFNQSQLKSNDRNQKDLLVE